MPTLARPSKFSMQLALTATFACSIFSAWTLPLQVGELVHRYDWSPVDAGSAASLQLLLTSLVMVGVAPFLPRVRPKLFATLGALVAMTGFVLIAFASATPALAVLGLALSGFGQGIASAGASALAAVATDRSRAYAIASTLGILFSALCLVLMPLAHFGLQADSVFLASAIAMFVCLIVVLGCPITSSPKGQPRGTTTRAGWAWSMLYPLAGSFILFLGLNAVWPFAESLGLRTGLTAPFLSLALFLTAVAGAAGPLLLVVLARGRDPRVTTALAFILTGATIFLACVPLKSAFMFGVVGQSAGQIAINVLVFNLCFRADPTGRLSTVTGSCVIFGCSAGPALGGALITHGPLILGATALVLSAAAWAMIDRFDRRLTAAL